MLVSLMETPCVGSLNGSDNVVVAAIMAAANSRA
jgi:hypothetical protein